MEHNDTYILILGAFIVFMLGFMIGKMEGEIYGVINGREMEKRYQSYIRKDDDNAIEIRENKKDDI